MKYKTLSIIIPCYNEYPTIEKLLERVLSASTLGLKKEIIIIDDASTDGTKAYLKKLKLSIPHKIIFKQKNGGKGSCVRAGLLQATGDIVLIQDADLEYDPDEYSLLLQPIIENQADVVYGSRFVGGKPHRVVYYWHYVMNKVLTTLSNMMTNINLTDMETCYKVFRRDIVNQISKQLQANDFGFEPEVTARLSKIPSVRFYEVGVSYYGRTYAEGKHITAYDGIKAVGQIVRYNLFN